MWIKSYVKWVFNCLQFASALVDYETLQLNASWIFIDLVFSSVYVCRLKLQHHDRGLFSEWMSMKWWKTLSRSSSQHRLVQFLSYVHNIKHVIHMHLNLKCTIQFRNRDRHWGDRENLFLLRWRGSSCVLLSRRVLIHTVYTWIERHLFKYVIVVAWNSFLKRSNKI